MDRNVTPIIPARDLIDDGDMHLRHALPQEQRIALGPFVFIDHYRHHRQRGIGDRPHPHAGIEVVSYLLDGSVEHRDSMGFRDRLGPGDVQFIRTGRGMLHVSGGLHLPRRYFWSDCSWKPFGYEEVTTLRINKQGQVCMTCVPGSGYHRRPFQCTYCLHQPL